jgi:hypothetical protein
MQFGLCSRKGAGYFAAFLVLAQRFFCASEIRLRASVLNVRFAAILTLKVLPPSVPLPPNNRFRALVRRVSSASIHATNSLVFIT